MPSASGVTSPRTLGTDPTTSDLEQVVGVVVRERKNAARTVIFEAAAERHLARRGERAGNGVARETLERAAFELERELARAIDPLSGQRAAGDTSCAALAGSSAAS